MSWLAVLETGLANLDAMAASAAGALVSAVWQGAALALLAWAGLRLFPRLSAAARSAVWLSVFVLLAGLQVMPLVAGSGSALEARGASAPAIHLDPRWSLAIASLWLALTAFRAAQIVHGVLCLRRLGRSAAEISAPEELDLDGLAEEMAGRKARICASDEVARPCVIGFFRPRILIPAKLLQNLSEAELRQVLVHEMEHLRRADDWTNLAQKLIVAAFPLNPALGWVERRLCAERELACDDRVLAEGIGRKAYALCLTRLAEFALTARGFSLVLGAWEQRPELVRRVERILASPARVMSRPAALGVTAGVLAVALYAAVELSHSPELVSFAPAQGRANSPSTVQQERQPLEVASSDVRAEARTLPSGKLADSQFARPTLVKATFTVEREAAARQKPARLAQMEKMIPAAALREANPKARAFRQAAEPEVKLAGLRMGPPPNYGKLMTLAGWSGMDAEQGLILAEFRQGRTPPATVIPAVYIVATPNGWLIVQI
jgi:beta-lactamase regulating signal transducer with metallopeptidase domain